jgi:hypothetical protein
MSWFKIKRKTINYVGKVTQTDGLEEWIEVVLDENIKDIKFSVFGKKRIAKQKLVKQFSEITARDEVRAAIENEAINYITKIGDIAEYYPANKLPKSDGYPPVVIVPRLVLNAIAFKNANTNLLESHELSKVPNSALMKEKFILQLVIELDKVLVEEPISSRKSFSCDKGWKIISSSKEYDWHGAFPGHYYLYKPLTKISSKSETEIEKEKNNLDIWLGRLSDNIKTEMIGQLLTYYKCFE